MRKWSHLVASKFRNWRKFNWQQPFGEWVDATWLGEPSHAVALLTAQCGGPAVQPLRRMHHRHIAIMVHFGAFWPLIRSAECWVLSAEYGALPLLNPEPRTLNPCACQVDAGSAASARACSA